MSTRMSLPPRSLAILILLARGRATRVTAVTPGRWTRTVSPSWRLPILPVAVAVVTITIPVAIAATLSATVAVTIPIPNVQS